jgi:uncharacterized protein
MPRRGTAGAWLVPLLLILACARLRGAEAIPPAPDRYFNDYAGLVSPPTAAALNSTLDQFERATSSQVVVAVFPRMASDSSVEDYTVRVFNAWKIGRKGLNNGAALFVFADTHDIRIVTGYGLEGALPDALCRRIIANEIIPRFRSGDFDGGLGAGVNAMIAATRGEYRGNGSTVDDSGANATSLVRIIAILVFIVVWSVIRSRQHVVYGGVGRRTVWGGGPWIFPGGAGAGGGGGGFSGGGFSGGGGSSGGGGAGGRW